MYLRNFSFCLPLKIIFIFSFLSFLNYNQVISQENNGEAFLLPSVESYKQALKSSGNKQIVRLSWYSQKAPGSEIIAAKHSRKAASAFSGWSKVAISSDNSKQEVINNLTLPDQWPGKRNYKTAWYHLNVELSAFAPNSLWIKFDAVAHKCVLFINGEVAGDHLGGFTPFEFDITRLVKPGINSIALWVQDGSAVTDEENRRTISQVGLDRPGENRTVAGLRGGVYFELRQPVHIVRNRVRTSTRNQTLKLETWLNSYTEGCEIQHEIFEWPDGRKPVMTFPLTKVNPEEFIEGKPIINTIEWQTAKLWSPENPNLYVVRTTIKSNGKTESYDSRFGFREFWIEGKEFYLNGKPIRLRGHSTLTNLLSLHPEGSIELNRKILEFLKNEFYYNSVRLHHTIFPPWASLAADEAGYLVVNQSAIWSAMRENYTRGSDELLPNIEKQFEEWYWRDVNNPSVVIWDVENEMIRGSGRSSSIDWVLKLDSMILKHEPEAIIQHSGAAWYHPQQQIIHVHMQEQYARIMQHWQAIGTVPLVLGEFWMGGRGETRLPNGYEFQNREEWHIEEARILREKILEMRYYGVSGIMCHILHSHAVDLANASFLHNQSDSGQGEIYKWRYPGLRNMAGRGLAPVVGFIWPRSASVISDSPFEREVVVCNDSENNKTLTVTCVYGKQQIIQHLTLEPASQRRLNVRFNPEEDLSTIGVTVHDEDGKLLESDSLFISVIPKSKLATPTFNRTIVVVPAIDETLKAALEKFSISYEVSESFPADATNTIVIVSSQTAVHSLANNPSDVRRYLAEGGRLLSMPQSSSPRWLPVKIPFWSAIRSSGPDFETAGWESTNKDLMYTRELEIYAPGHPIFSGLETIDLKEWNRSDGRISDDAFVRPNAVNVEPGGAYRALLGATRRENSSLIETKIGKGTALLCQVKVAEEIENPAAQLLFLNMLRYLNGEGWKPELMKVGLSGDLTPALMSRLTGLDTVSFTSSFSGVPLVIAGNNADIGQLIELASEGTTVLVLSSRTTDKLPGFKVDSEMGYNYTGTRKNSSDDPLFWGISSASFLPLEQTPAKGSITSFPVDANILLNGQCCGSINYFNIGFGGLESQFEASPLVVSQKIGKGRIIASTLEPFDPLSELHRQMLSTILANAGAPVPDVEGTFTKIKVENTIPLNFDGRLDDWTNDMEDRNVSPWARAIPVALGSRDIQEGNLEHDRDLSVILYFLNDNAHLYIGGIGFYSGVPPRLEITINDETIEYNFANQSVSIGNQQSSKILQANGSQRASELADTRLLDFTQVTARIGNAEIANINGHTFELGIPWHLLGHTTMPEKLLATFKLEQKEVAILQLPSNKDGEKERVVLQIINMINSKK